MLLYLSSFDRYPARNFCSLINFRLLVVIDAESSLEILTLFFVLPSLSLCLLPGCLLTKILLLFKLVLLVAICKFAHLLIFVRGEMSSLSKVLGLQRLPKMVLL